MKALHCADMGMVDCNYVARGETEKDVMDKITNHGKTVHPGMMEKMDKEKMMMMMRTNMRTEA